MKAIGIDLAGKKSNPSGLAFIHRKELETKLAKGDDEIFSFCINQGPDVVAIDAPLSFPKEGGLRRADAELIGRGFRVLPPKLGGMKMLTQRGIKIAKKLRQENFEVIEIHSRTSGMILFETDERELWISGLVERNWEVDPDASEHEIDAALGALTGLLYLKGKTSRVGEEGKEIVIPRERLPAP